MSGIVELVLSRKALLIVAGTAVGLFAVAAIVAAIYGNPASNDAADAVGAIAWFGWMIAALVLMLLSVAAIVRRSVGARGAEG